MVSLVKVNYNNYTQAIIIVFYKPNFPSMQTVSAYGTDQNTTISLSNYGEDFYIGFMPNAVTADYLQLIVGAKDSSPVQFGVGINSGVVYTGTTTATSPVTVNLPVSLLTISATYNYRNKGVHIYSIGGGSVSVLAINYWPGSVGDYLAYPCHAMGSASYEYFVVSTETSDSTLESEFLLVGCVDDTSITITPTKPVSIPVDVQSSTSPLTTVQTGTDHKIVLNKLQTLLIKSPGEDLSGTRIVSNKPLTVISGHECGNVPSSQKFCEHLAEQIPPTSTWGRNFLLVPFGGRNVGQYFKIISSQDGTTVVCTCNSVSTTQTLSSAGNAHTFFTSSTEYCSVVSNKPVIVSQLGIGGTLDGIGDPIISIVPSLDQYTNHYSFSTLNSTQFSIHQISVSVLPQYYQPSKIFLDGQPITATWSQIYNSGGTVVGYGCNLSVTAGVVHTVHHDNPTGKLAVMVYGWNFPPRMRGYGYLAGLSFSSLSSGMIKGSLW